MKWVGPSASYDRGIYRKHEEIYVAHICAKVNQQHDQHGINLTPYHHRRKTLAFGFILDRNASKQIRPCTGSGTPARNILIIETQIDFKWQIWCN